MPLRLALAVEPGTSLHDPTVRLDRRAADAAARAGGGTVLVYRLIPDTLVVFSATGRIASEAFRQMAGIQAVHVPYKTSAQAITDLISGQLHFLVTDAGLGVAQSQAGKVKALGVTSSQRVPAVPDLPTIAEAGLPGYEFVAWLALFAPAKTPPAVVSRIAELVNTVVRSPGMLEYLAKMYALPFPGDPESLRQLVERDTARWGQLVKAAGIEPE